MNTIGLEKNQAGALADQLNTLLSGYQVYYQNLRGFHWNIQGKNFFDLHVKFEELYNEANVTIDELAERILTLGEKPLHAFDDYIERSTVAIKKERYSSSETAEGVIESLLPLLELEREILTNAANFGDEGTASMMSDIISIQEKIIWMFNAYLN